MLNFDFSGKNIVITGGIRGIGYSVAKLFSSYSSNMVLGYRSDQDLAESVQSELSLGNSSVKTLRADLASQNECDRFMKESLDFLSEIDIFVHCCGIRQDAPASMMKNDSWNKVIDVNLNSAFYCSRIAAKKMLKRRVGRIVFISSVSASVGGPGQSNYAASKSGIEGLMRVMSREFADRNVTVNCVSPGLIDTNMSRDINKSMREFYLSVIPMKKFGKPEDVASAVAFLSSDESSYVTGQILKVNGGMDVS
tara:strand:+ start:3654 stop:4409 length:756 start_codon:yes stop_codon:yes gene_type:complete